MLGKAVGKLGKGERRSGTKTEEGIIIGRKMKYELTIVCTYYDRIQYENNLGDSLKHQKFCDYQLLLVDNSKATYGNMYEAVESVRQEICGEHVMLVHPDISLPEESTLSNIVSCIHADKNIYGILGSAGATETFLCAALTHGNTSFRPGRNATDFQEVHTLDECLIVMPRRLFDDYPLADLGKTWHMYIVELCCRLRRDGYRAAVMPVPVIHWSSGTITLNFFCTRLRVAWRYRKDFPQIETTCGTFNTGLRYVIFGFPHDLYWLFMRDLKRFMLEKTPWLSFIFRFTGYLRNKKINGGKEDESRQE